VASNLTLDATVNPDFGQVESDPAVLNLTAYESFFDERRPFFVAGRGLFRFDVNCTAVNDCSTGEGLFYLASHRAHARARGCLWRHTPQQPSTILTAGKPRAGSATVSCRLARRSHPARDGARRHDFRAGGELRVIRARQACAAAKQCRASSPREPLARQLELAYMTRSAYAGAVDFHPRFPGSVRGRWIARRQPGGW